MLRAVTPARPRLQRGPQRDFESRFDGTQEHPDLGQYDGNHVPLDVLRDVFPDDFNTISKLDSFAIIRDPYDRFVSSLAQRVRMFTNRSVQEMSAQEMQNEVDTVIAYLEGHSGLLSRDYAHFQRQVDFVDLDGRHFVRHLFPIERTDAVVEEFGRRLGIEVRTGLKANYSRWNQTQRIIKSIRSARKIYRSLLPQSVIQAVRQMILTVLPDQQPPRKYETLFASETVRDFITQYYARDIDLRAEVEAQLTDLGREAEDANASPDASTFAYDGGGHAGEMVGEGR